MTTRRIAPSPAEQWRVRVWDGHSTSEIDMAGTYGQVSNNCSRFPPSFIWSITPVKPVSETAQA